MIDEDSLQKLRQRNSAILPQLDERQRRLFAASEARAAGHGGIAAVSRVTRIAASTIGRGLKELDAPPPLKLGGVRRPGGGRKSLTETDPGLLDDLNALVEPDARGDPRPPVRWRGKSLRGLAADLDKLGHKMSHTVVGELLKKQKFSLQANSKTREGADNPDRDAQFHVINDAVKAAMTENQPAISVDTKKKELVGDFKNPGRDWRKQGDPEEVRVHDFLIREKIQTQSSTDPRFEVCEDSRSLAEAEVAAPSYDVWLQPFDQLLQTEPPCPACHVSDLPLEFVERLWRDAPLAPVIRDAEPKKLALFRSRHRALRLVDLEPQLVGQEPAHRGHDPFAGATAANIDVAVVGVPAKAVTASGQFLVEVVKHEIAEDGRKRAAMRRPRLHR